MRVLIIGDLHCPCDHKDYLNFCKKIQKIHKTTHTVFIGDIVDHEAISMHEKNPSLPGAGDEYEQAAIAVKYWAKNFPRADVCIGNHDARVFKKAAKNGIPDFYLKHYKEIYNTPNWNWDYSFTIDGVHYSHGDGWSGHHPAFTAAKSKLESVVCGHHHSIAGINWVRGPKSQFFGMNVGSGVDQSHPAFMYSKPHLKRSILSCGVVINGINPYMEIM